MIQSWRWKYLNSITMLTKTFSVLKTQTYINSYTLNTFLSLCQSFCRYNNHFCDVHTRLCLVWDCKFHCIISVSSVLTFHSRQNNAISVYQNQAKALYVHLFVWSDALRPSQHQWSCRDDAPLLWDIYPILGWHDTQNRLHKYNHPTKPIRLICMDAFD